MKVVFSEHGLEAEHSIAVKLDLPGFIEYWEGGALWRININT